MNANHQNFLHVMPVWCLRCMKHHCQYEFDYLEQRLMAYQKDPYLDKRPEKFVAQCLKQQLQRQYRRLQRLEQALEIHDQAA